MLLLVERPFVRVNDVLDMTLCSRDATSARAHRSGR